MVTNWPVERTALKEWAVLVDAMARGDIIAMVRKGGIRDQRGGFDIRAPRFFLYPTYFHENEADLAPRFLPMLEESRTRQPPPGRVRIEYIADGAISWRVEDLKKLEGVQHEAGLSWKAIEARFNYRYPGVYVVALRVSRLLTPVEIPERPRYGGCVSWLRFDDAIDCGDVAPVMSDSSFEARLRALIPALANRPTHEECPS
jgi:hypothetical protein